VFLRLLAFAEPHTRGRGLDLPTWRSSMFRHGKSNPNSAGRVIVNKTNPSLSLYKWVRVVHGLNKDCNDWGTESFTPIRFFARTKQNVPDMI
jgi:hypothetical protein